MSTTTLKNHRIVPHEEWLKARKAHLAKEKEFSRVRDELAKARRELPWERVDKRYVFDGPKGKETLADLFGKKSQLVVYHFMFSPENEAVARTARSGPITTTAWAGISPSAT